jgi:hypothetical protein
MPVKSMHLLNVTKFTGSDCIRPRNAGERREVLTGRGAVVSANVRAFVEDLVAIISAGGLRECEKDVLKKSYLGDKNLMFDRITNEPEAEIIESLLEKRLLKLNHASPAGWYQQYRFTKKGSQLASALIMLEEIL